MSRIRVPIYVQLVAMTLALFLTYLISKKNCGLETRVRVTRGHRNWYHSIACLPFSVIVLW